MIAEVTSLQNLYQQNPADDILKRLTIAQVSYFSLPHSKEKLLNMLNKLSFNHHSHLWAVNNFHAAYKAQWIPQKIPTLIFSSDQDHITPLKFFTELNEFQRENILIREITNASHFPWMENPESVKQLFVDYCQWLKNNSTN